MTLEHFSEIQSHADNRASQPIPQPRHICDEGLRMCKYKQKYPKQHNRNNISIHGDTWKNQFPAAWALRAQVGAVLPADLLEGGMDWLDFNLHISAGAFFKAGGGNRVGIATAPSYISKSGKETAHVGRFWSGCSGATAPQPRPWRAVARALCPAPATRCYDDCGLSRAPQTPCYPSQSASRRGSSMPAGR